MAADLAGVPVDLALERLDFSKQLIVGSGLLSFGHICVSPSPAMVWRFGDFELDTGHYEPRRRAKLVAA